jgi:hypothetical protein
MWDVKYSIDEVYVQNKKDILAVSVIGGMRDIGSSDQV